MQIGLLNHLNYPKGNSLPLAGNAADDGSDVASSAASTGRGAAVRPTAPVAQAAGVLVTIQADSATAAGIAVPDGLVYSNGRKAATSSDTDGDTDRMAQQHSQAVLRNAGSSTSLTVGKDGVLVAKPAAAADAKPTDFVTFAVNTMRDFADEQERLKQTTQAEGTATASILPRSLAEVQKLASRFKLFA
jgi:hypothetical protein